MKTNIFERITNQIVAAIEAGTPDYKMPWHRTGQALEFPTNAITGRAYRGLNVLTLWLCGESAGFGSGKWATYRQWSEHRAQVRKGERGSPVFFWQSKAVNGTTSEEGEERRGLGFVAKTFTVFNADQIIDYQCGPAPVLTDDQRVAAADDFVRSTGAKIEHGGDRAYYSPGYDRVQMPEFWQFKSSAAYYSVLAHELTHWTGAKHRLDRNLSHRFGSFDYAMEELVAELGAAFTCASLGLRTEPRRDHAPYIASWLKALRGDSRAIFTAARKAQEAADYLFALNKPIGSIEPGPSERCAKATIGTLIRSDLNETPL